MGNFVDLKSADGQVFPAYIAEPAGKPRLFAFVQFKSSTMA